MPVNSPASGGDPEHGGFAEQLNAILGLAQPEQAEAIQREAAQINDRVTGLLRARDTGDPEARAAADAELEQIQDRVLKMRDSVLRGRDTVRAFSPAVGASFPDGDDTWYKVSSRSEDPEHPFSSAVVRESELPAVRAAIANNLNWEIISVEPAARPEWASSSPGSQGRPAAASHRMKPTAGPSARR